MIDLNCIQRFGVNVMKQGKIPDHVAFIMDGNRRHAKRQNKHSFKGHEQGAESLKKILCLCLQLGIKEASFFCFSIDNFKRTAEEVSKLMQLAINSFDEVSEFSELLMSKQVRVKVVGNVELLREDVRQALKTVESRTEKFSRMQANLCFAYDSLEEINNAISECRQASEEANEYNLYKHLMIKSPVDIMVRTSNESRLSNFLLAQCPYSQICILRENWPQMGMVSFLKILLNFNLNYSSFAAAKQRWQISLRNMGRQQQQKVEHINAQKQKMSQKQVNPSAERRHNLSKNHPISNITQLEESALSEEDEKLIKSL